MTGRPWVLGETTWQVVRETAWDAAILPWGATEAHNLHLPYATDVVETEAVAVRAAGRAWERGARVAVLPAVPFGVNTQQLDIPLTLNMNPSTQLQVLADVAESLEGHVARLVVLNGHGGNDFRPMIRELQARTELFLCLVSWYQLVPPSRFFETPGDHAGQLETSLMLHLRPDLVAPLEEAGPGAARPFAVRALADGRAWAPRRWTRVTDDTGVGDPAGSSAEAGAHYFDAVTEALADFLVELAAVGVDELYGEGRSG